MSQTRSSPKNHKTLFTQKLPAFNYHMLFWPKNRTISRDHDKLPECAKSLMTLSLIKIFLLCLCWWLFTSCVGTSDWLSGPPQWQNSDLESSLRLSTIGIGVTTKEEVLTRFGTPTDRQGSMIDGITFESLSYSTTEATITPYQYIPLFGAVAFWEPLENHAPSAAISFSNEDTVSGLTISTVRAFGDIRSSEKFNKSDSSTSFYGMRNPDVTHASTSAHRFNF